MIYVRYDVICRNIKSILEVSTKVSQVIADEIGGKTLILSPLEIADEKKSYLERMEQNVSNLKEALCA